MSSQEENVALAREGMAAYQRGDMEAVLAWLAPDVEIFSQEDLPNPGRFRGRDGYLSWVVNWLDAWETFEVEPEDFVPVGEHHVVIPARQRVVGKGSGVEVRMTVCYMLEIHAGVTTRLHFYGDREQAMEAARAGQ